MRRLLVAGTALLATACFAATAHADTVRECGNYGITRGQTPEADGTLRPHWTMKQLDGAGIFNVTARNVGCRAARRVVLRSRGSGVPTSKWRWRGWGCSTLDEKWEYMMIRCTKASRAVRWETGA